MKYVSISLLILISLAVSAQEKDQTVTELPAAVQKTVDKETHGGEILKKEKRAANMRSVSPKWA